jgi:predicted RNA-binding Zn ribbon-like protein
MKESGGTGMEAIEELDIAMPNFGELTGNWLCLDFTHTLDERYSARPEELLRSYSDLVAWGIYQGVLTKEEAQRLLSLAKQKPGEAVAALSRAIDAREAIYRLFYALSEGGDPPEADMAHLNALLAGALSHARLARTDNGYVLGWQKEGELDALLWNVVRSAADLLTSDRLDDVRACAADDCRWLFLDTSKNHSRRWCDMQTCGNQAKARRHYSRKRQGISRA